MLSASISSASNISLDSSLRAQMARAADGDYKTAGPGHRVKDSDGDYKPTPKASVGATASTANATLAALTTLSKGG